MRIQIGSLSLLALCLGCGNPNADDPSSPGSGGVLDAGGSGGGGAGSGGSAGANSKNIFDSVDAGKLKQFLRELTGDVDVSVGGKTFRITERWSPEGKQRFREYWKQYFTGLGAEVNEQTFPVPNLVGESEGHNVEAIFPGKSPDSLVIVAHYDTVGVTGKETENPGVDDAGSGLATMMEAARLFAPRSDREVTLRFAAIDYEEISDNLDGDLAYASYLKDTASANGFNVIGAANNDQTAWSCWSENSCASGAPAAPESSFEVFTCSGDAHAYDFPQFKQAMGDVAKAHAAISIRFGCDDSYTSDASAFWQSGIPAYLVTEYSSDNNPHFDDTGDDTLAHVNWDYYLRISEIEIATQAKLIGIPGD